uniref:Uncharacterized protein n=1 Tax=Panagrolaimus sp. JU765 TaxID=591449 RepID=A0AC34QCV0_9BILA
MNADNSRKEAGCAKENEYSHGVDGNNTVPAVKYCYGEKCNVPDNDHRHCHSGAYGDCEWTSSEGTLNEKEECGQHDSWDICVHQIWTFKDDSTRVCHKYLCHHNYVNHGEELIYKKAPNVAGGSMKDEIGNATVQVEQCMVTDRSKSCFEVQNPKIQCYWSDSSGVNDELKLINCSDYVSHCVWTESYDGKVTSRDCAPTNMAFGKKRCFAISNGEKCYAPGTASNGKVEAIKECYTGVEGNCTYFFKSEIGEPFYHAPIKTQCKGWSQYCYKSEFHGNGTECVWYNCNVYKGSANHLDFEGKDTVVKEHVLHGITWNVTSTRCEGEGCNCKGDNCVKTNSGNKLVAMAVYFMVAIQGLLILG